MLIQNYTSAYRIGFTNITIFLCVLSITYSIQKFLKLVCEVFKDYILSKKFQKCNKYYLKKKLFCSEINIFINLN